MARKKKKKISKKKVSKKKKKKIKLRKKPPKVKPGQTCPATPVLWHEDLKFPFCDYCLSGRECYCGAAEEHGSCDFCQEGCSCDYQLVLDGVVCECECECDRKEEEGECDDCCVCDYMQRDDLPDACYCECSCSRCTCYCHCGELIIDADSYNQWVRDTCLVCDPECLSEEHLNIPDVLTFPEVEATRRCIIDIGEYEFSVVTLPMAVRRKVPIPGIGSLRAQMGMPSFLMEPTDFQEIDEVTRVSIIQDGCKGLIRFSGPIHTATIAKPDPYSGRNRVWMSLTPMEVMSQKPGLEKAFGNVLIGGLGMGWLTHRILEKPEVKSVTQIELDLDILRFFGIPLEEMFPGKIDLIHDDFWGFLNQHDMNLYDTILVDIWPKYKDARRDNLFRALRKSHPNVWGWGEQKIINE